MVSLIEQKLTKKQWSPQQIAGILTASGASVSHTTIYRHIRRDRIAGRQLYKNLRR
jgi:IS30 family transposase